MPNGVGCLGRFLAERILENDQWQARARRAAARRAHRGRLMQK